MHDCRSSGSCAIHSCNYNIATARRYQETVSLKTINSLQQENARLNEAIRTRDTQAAGGGSDRPANDPRQAYQHPESDAPLAVPLIQRIGSRTSLASRLSSVTFPSISDVPVILEPPLQTSLDPIASDPPPPSSFSFNTRRSSGMERLRAASNDMMVDATQQCDR